MKLTELNAIHEYLMWCRSYSRTMIYRAHYDPSLEMRESTVIALVNEQNRRIRELTKLCTIIAAEIDAKTASSQGVDKSTTQPRKPVKGRKTAHNTHSKRQTQQAEGRKPKNARR